jgi:hypothetical protein
VTICRESIRRLRSGQLLHWTNRRIGAGRFGYGHPSKEVWL